MREKERTIGLGKITNEFEAQAKNVHLRHDQQPVAVAGLPARQGRVPGGGAPKPRDVLLEPGPVAPVLGVQIEEPLRYLVGLVGVLERNVDEQRGGATIPTARRLTMLAEYLKSQFGHSGARAAPLSEN